MAIEPRRLLSALSAEHAVSGSALADTLGVTRAAVWKQIEALRELGAPIQGEAGSGYRLDWPVELLDAERILADIDASTRARLGAFDVHWQIDSTSTALMRRAGDTSADLQVCLAEAQSAGRGRRGRVWQSPLGGNIYFSLLKRFDRGMGDLAGLSLVVGVAVVAALLDCGATDVGLKWPNDVLADGRKLAGILVELGGEFLGPCHAVIGIGINLRLPAAARAQIDQPATDLASVLAAAPPRNHLAACLLGRLIAALDQFSVAGFSAFQNAYLRSDLLRGRAVRVLAAGQSHEGIATGVDERGALIVKHGDVLSRYDSAEVSVRAAA